MTDDRHDEPTLEDRLARLEEILARGPVRSEVTP